MVVLAMIAIVSIWLSLTLVCGAALEAHTPMADNPEQTVSANGMTLSWAFEKDRLICHVSAPTHGWVAVGFNPREGLAGTNLIMATVRQGKVDIADRYVLKPGDHRSVTSLGGQSKVIALQGREGAGVTDITFELTITEDAWHHTLKEGSTVHLLLAYSQADDFDHHSSMRTHRQVKL